MAEQRIDPPPGGPQPPAARTQGQGQGRRPRPSGWLVGGAVFAAVFIAGIIINAINEGHGTPQDFQSLLVQADAQQVVVCGVLASPVAAHATGNMTLRGPRAAVDPADSVVVLLAPGQGPQTGLPAGANVEVSATVHVRAGPGGSTVAELIDPTGIQGMRACPSEIVPVSY